MDKNGLLRVVAIEPNDLPGLSAAFEKYNKGKYKVAGFFHEIVMMNYGAKLLSCRFLKRAYSLCRKHDVLTVCDEIQSCLWYPGLYMFRECDIRPDLVAIGKGFPGGEYCASKLLLNDRCDCLPQFGALVTNGQEEVASLAYLVTMRWALANEDVTRAIGDYYEERLNALGCRYKSIVDSVQGNRHLEGIHFNDMKQARAFAADLNRCGLDISIQTYKESCPPAALTKLPLICGYEVVDFVVDRMQRALEGISKS